MFLMHLNIQEEIHREASVTLCESRNAWLHMWLFAACIVNLTCCSASRLTLNGCAFPSSMTCGDQSLVSGLQDRKYSIRPVWYKMCHIKQYDPFWRHVITCISKTSIGQQGLYYIYHALAKPSHISHHHLFFIFLPFSTWCNKTGVE